MIILCLISAIATFITLICVVSYDNKKNIEFVKTHSYKYNSILQLNNSYHFNYNIDPYYVCHKEFYFKPDFDKCNKGRLIREYIFSDLLMFHSIYNEINSNRKIYTDYIHKYVSIRKDTKLPITGVMKLKKFQSIEDKLCQQILLNNPPLDMIIECRTEYTTRAGRNHHESSYKYGINEIRNIISEKNKHIFNVFPLVFPSDVQVIYDNKPYSYNGNMNTKTNVYKNTNIILHSIVGFISLILLLTGVSLSSLLFTNIGLYFLTIHSSTILSKLDNHATGKTITILSNIIGTLLLLPFIPSSEEFSSLEFSRGTITLISLPILAIVYSIIHCCLIVKRSDKLKIDTESSISFFLINIAISILTPFTIELLLLILAPVVTFIFSILFISCLGGSSHYVSGHYRRGTWTKNGYRCGGYVSGHYRRRY